MNGKRLPYARNSELKWQETGPGVRRKVLCYDDRMMMVRVAFEAGAKGVDHSHPHLQCSYVESGVFEITIAGRTERLTAGDSFLASPNATHNATAIEAGTLIDVFAPMREDFV
jgi:quercetin dioxygenase-like cupin family protein